MMSRATEALAFPGRCGFCLNLLDDLVDVRILPCKHEACTACLRAEVQLRHKVVCFQCKEKYEDIEIDEFMTRKTKPRFKPHSEERFVCDTKNCEQPADKYCVPCQHLFCSQHKQVHDSLFSHEELDIEEYNVKKNKFILKDCSRHSDGKINMACEKCRVLLCDKCISVNESLNCGDSTTELHAIRPLSDLADKLRSELNEKIAELRIKDRVVEDILKHNLQTCDQLLEVSRDMCEQIDQKASDMKVRIDELTEKLKSDVRNFVVKVKSDVDELNENLLEHSEKSDDLKSEVDELITGENSDVFTDHEMFLERVVTLQGSEFRHWKYQVKPYKLIDSGQHVEFPLSYCPIQLTSLQLLQTVNVGAKCYAVGYTKTGQLVYGGGNKISGLGWNCDSFSKTYIDSLCVSNNELFIHNTGSKNSHLYSINLMEKRNPTKVLNLEGDWYDTNIAVSKDVILITSTQDKCVRVFSRKTFKLEYDIHHESFSKRPWGIAVLNDSTIVTSDKKMGTLTNFTLSSPSTIIWKIDGLKNPCGVTVDRKRNTILAGADGGVVYYISSEGQLSNTLTLPDTGDICNLSLHNDCLAVADSRQHVNTYQCVYG